MVIVEGLPAGLNVTAEQIQNELGRRRLAMGAALASVSKSTK